jgi:septum formation protein
MLVLASQSPRRLALLRAAGFDPVVRVPDVDETRREGEPPETYARRLARAKAEAVDHSPDDVVVAADTVVVADGQLLGKPVDATDACRMLRLLSGREHVVITGVAIKHGAGLRDDAARTRVWFSELTDAEIAEYVASNEPMDKAGGYAIQGLASRFVARIEGCYFNVVGLPVPLVYSHLKQLGLVEALSVASRRSAPAARR